MIFRILFLLMLFPGRGFSQLDTLYGPVKTVKDSLVPTSYLVVIVSSRGEDFGQYSFDEESILKEFRKQYRNLLYPRYIVNYEKSFDQKGRILTHTRFPIGSFTSVSTETYKYDEYGNKIQVKDETKGPEYSNIGITNYEYRYFPDSTDRVIGELNYSTNSADFSHRQFSYNKKNQLIEVKELGGSSFNIQKNYTYDEAGRLTAIIWHRSDKIVRYDFEKGFEIAVDSLSEPTRDEFKFNDLGLLVQQVSDCGAYPKEQRCKNAIHEYDKKGRKAKSWYYWRNELYSRREYEYYPDNSLRKISWFRKDEKQSTNSVEYFYKHQDLAKAVLSEDNRVKIIDFKYKFDKYDNWVEQNKYVNNELVYSRTRKITYWK